MRVSKQIEWDMGHRITNHRSKCRNIHGHRYKAQICVEGSIVDLKNTSAEGMVIDFGDIKELGIKLIYDVLDHGFMVWDKDKKIIEFFKNNSDQKCVIVPFVPTAEKIAEWIFTRLNKRIKDRYGTGLKLYSIKLWETPTSLAEYARSDYAKMKGKK